MKKMDFQALRNYTADLRRLCKISNLLHSLDEKACNEGLSTRGEARETALEKEAEEIAKTYGLITYRQDDPIGCSLFLITKEIKASGQYTDGIAIY